MKKGLLLLMAGLAGLFAPGCGERIQETIEEAESVREANIREEAGNRLEAVLESGTLIIGISADYAPFAFPDQREEGSYAGSDIELGNYLADSLGVNAEFRNMEFEACLQAVKDGSVDLALLGMLPKPDRRSGVDFTDIYYQPGEQALLVEKGRKGRFASLEDFEGLTVAAQYGTLQAQLVTEQLPGSYLELTDTVTDGVLMLQNGKADAVAVEDQTAEELLEEYPELKMAEARFVYTSQGIVGGVGKDEPELLEAVNEAIAQVKEQGLYPGWLDKANQQAASWQTLPKKPAPAGERPDGADGEKSVKTP